MSCTYLRFWNITTNPEPNFININRLVLLWNNCEHSQPTLWREISKEQLFHKIEVEQMLVVPNNITLSYFGGNNEVLPVRHGPYNTCHGHTCTLISMSFVFYLSTMPIVADICTFGALVWYSKVKGFGMTFQGYYPAFLQYYYQLGGSDLKQLKRLPLSFKDSDFIFDDNDMGHCNITLKSIKVQIWDTKIRHSVKLMIFITKI